MDNVNPFEKMQKRRINKYKILTLCITLVLMYLKYSYYNDYNLSLQELLLRANRNVDDGQKCAVPKIYKDFKNYERKYTFSYHDIFRKETYNQGQHIVGFLHIPKTGGSHLNAQITSQLLALVKEAHGPSPIDRSSKERQTLKSRHSQVCTISGLHTDWMSTQRCLLAISNLHKSKSEDEIKQGSDTMLMTMLRDPIHRYLSEWMHINRGSTLLPTITTCSATSKLQLEPIPGCVTGSSPVNANIQETHDAIHAKAFSTFSQTYAHWRGVHLERFLACPNNTANNRMTYMLADRRLLGKDCSVKWLTQEQVDDRLLESAKNNLRKMSFFGLSEYQVETQILLKEMLGIEHIANFTQRTKDHVSCFALSDEQRASISKLNNLDVILYDYARDLFYQRLKGHKILK